MAAVDAAAQPHLAEHPDLGCRREQAGMGADPSESVVRVAIVDLTGMEGRAPAGEVDSGPDGHPPLERVALLGDGVLVLREGGEVARAPEPARPHDELGEEVGERSSGRPLDRKADGHVAEVAVLEA